MKKLICFIFLFTPFHLFSQHSLKNYIDTVSLISLGRTPSSPNGSLKIWMAQKNQINYEEVFNDKNDGRFIGKIMINRDGSLIPIYTSRIWNGVADYIETSDSVILVNDGKRARQKNILKPFALPRWHRASLLYTYLYYALSRKMTSLSTPDQGKLYFTKVGSTVLDKETKPEKLSLYIIRADSSSNDWLHAWLNEKNELIAISLYDGNFDLIVPRLKEKRDELVQAEIAASWLNNQPTCTDCDSGAYRCKVVGTPDTLVNIKKRSFTFSDEGYSVTSDGQGAYITDWENIFIPAWRGCGLMLRASRFFKVDLNHPVKDGLGKPLGMIKVNGMPGSFIPSGASYGDEIMAQLNTSENGSQPSFQDLKIGETVKLAQLDFDLYINGLRHVMQMGPQPAGHCFKTKVNGDGTTQATITRVNKSEWVIDLPPGSTGRLFDQHNYNSNAVDKGLYYVSMHFIIKTLE